MRYLGKLRYGYFLGILILIGFLVRLAGIGYGLPYVEEFSWDESSNVEKALRFGTGDLNPHWFIYPTLHRYLLFLVYGLLFVFGNVVGMFHSRDDFILLFFSDPSMFYLIGRLITIVAGTALIPLCYILGKKAFDRKAGIVAASFMTFSPLDVLNSQLIKAHTIMVFLLGLSLIFAVLIYQNGRRRDYILAGLFAGLAISTKYNALPIIFPLILAHIFYFLEERKRCPLEMFAHRNILIGLSCVALAFLITTPYSILDFRTFIDSEVGILFFVKYFRSGASSFYLGSVVTSWQDRLAVSISAVGWSLVLVSILGLAYAGYRHNRKHILLFSFVVLYVIVLATVRFFPHFLLPITPVLFVLSGNAISALTSRLSLGSRGKIWFLVTIILIINAEPLIRDVRHNYLINQKDTRILAKEWIEANIPRGTKILMDQKYNPPLFVSRKTLMERLQQIREKDPTKGLGTEYKLRLNPEVVYDIHHIEHKLEGIVEEEQEARVYPLDYYRDNGFEYIIVNSYMYERYNEHNAHLYPKTMAFYRSLDQKFILIASFEGNSFNRPGPNIRIYKVK